MKCKRCGQEFTPPDVKTIICGSCADELREEEDACLAGTQAEAEAEAFDRWKAEEAERIARDRY